jgi:hypothetical protein
VNNPPYLWTFLIYATITIASLVVWMVAGALRQAGKSQIEYAAGIRIAGLELFGWLGLAVLLGVLGVFRPALDQPVPYIAFAIAFPIIVGAWFIFRTVSGANLVRNTQQSWMIGVQSYRGLGSMFLVLNGMNYLPPEFAIPAGFGDTLVGVLAIPVAAYYWSDAPGRKVIVAVWNVFGIADLVVAIATGFLTAPTPLQLLAFDHPNLLMGQFPAVLIPTFAVPLSILLHMASLKKLATEK